MGVPFKINFLDHVAIYVKDMNTSIEWYSRVLGLKKYQLKEWGEYPVFMLSGKSGIAIFPAKFKSEISNRNMNHVRIDHYAFNVTNEAFEIAQNYFKEIDIDFNFQDHFYFHSIYLNDPDGHKVELTTIKVDEKKFY